MVWWSALVTTDLATIPNSTDVTTSYYEIRKTNNNNLNYLIG